MVSSVFLKNDSTIGVGHPRVIYRHQDKTYYLTFSSFAGNESFPDAQSQTWLATTKTPFNLSSWQIHGPLFPPSVTYSSNAILWIRDNPNPNITDTVHFCFFSDSPYSDHISYATSYDLFHWNFSRHNVLFSTGQTGHFDDYFIYPGTQPVLLTDSTWLFLYNGATYNPSFRPNYNALTSVGWTILDVVNKSVIQVLHRSHDPLLSPTTMWELGDPPQLHYYPQTLTATGIRQLNTTTNQYLLFYSGAGSTVGSAVISVEQQTSDGTDGPPNPPVQQQLPPFSVYSVVGLVFSAIIFILVSTMVYIHRQRNRHSLYSAIEEHDVPSSSAMDSSEMDFEDTSEFSYQTF